MTPVICPYCNSEAKLVDSKVVYGKSYGYIYLCGNFPRCDSYVGVHKDTREPLGRMANAELRAAKIKAHNAFDPIWKERYKLKHAQDPKYTKGMARNSRYKKLAGILGISRQECHIGMFDVETCERVVEICKAGMLDDKILLID